MPPDCVTAPTPVGLPPTYVFDATVSVPELIVSAPRSAPPTVRKPPFCPLSAVMLTLGVSTPLPMVIELPAAPGSCAITTLPITVSVLVLPVMDAVPTLPLTPAAAVPRIRLDAASGVPKVALPPVCVKPPAPPLLPR